MASSKKSNNNSTNVTLALSQMVDVMKVQVSNTLVESSKELNLDQKSLQKLNFIITEVITNAYVNNVENIVKASK